MREEEAGNQTLIPPAVPADDTASSSNGEENEFRKYLEVTFTHRLIEHMKRAKIKALLEGE